MGVKESYFDRVVQNLHDMVDVKAKGNSDVTIGMQMVLMPEYRDQIMPLASLGKEIRPDYLVIKHCSDNEDGDLGVDDGPIAALYETLREAEALSDETYKVAIKWSKIDAGAKRDYQRCYGAPFRDPTDTGSGLVAPWRDVIQLSDTRSSTLGISSLPDLETFGRAMPDWEVMNLLASDAFSAQTMCGVLCLQHGVNTSLDRFIEGEAEIGPTTAKPPQHLNFI